jgi:hypothetical protein
VCDFPQGGSLGIALMAITILATITTIQRIVHVKRQLESTDQTHQ